MALHERLGRLWSFGLAPSVRCGEAPPSRLLTWLCELRRDEFNLEGGKQPLVTLLHEAFDMLQRELSQT